MKAVVLLLTAVTLATTGCTTMAGPFVTNISSDGADGLTIEKCSVQMDALMGTVSNKGCTQTTIKMASQRQEKNP